MNKLFWEYSEDSDQEARNLGLYFDSVLVIGENSLSGHVNEIVFIDCAGLFLKSLIDSTFSCAVPWSDQSCLFQGPLANVSLKLLDLQQEYV